MMSTCTDNTENSCHGNVEILSVARKNLYPTEGPVKTHSKNCYKIQEYTKITFDYVKAQKHFFFYKKK